MLAHYSCRKNQLRPGDSVILIRLQPVAVRQPIVLLTQERSPGRLQLCVAELSNLLPQCQHGLVYRYTADRLWWWALL